MGSEVFLDTAAGQKLCSRMARKLRQMYEDIDYCVKVRTFVVLAKVKKNCFLEPLQTVCFDYYMSLCRYP